MLEKLFRAKIKLVKTEHIPDEEDKKQEIYKRIYDGETYILLESKSRDNKLNVDGIRNFIGNLVENSIKMGLAKYSYLFDQNDSMQFWLKLAIESNVCIIFNKEQNEILIIGLQSDVENYQSKLLQIIKKVQEKQSTFVDKEYLSAQL